MKINTKKLTEMALLTAFALIIHSIEALIPQLIPVPGVKIGLSNIITLIAVYRLNRREAGLVVLMKVLLSCMFGGSLSALIYSASGAILSLAVMLPLSRVIPPQNMYITGILGAAAHNLGQIIAAIIVSHTPGLIMYLPVLMLSGCAAGFFTGLCAAFTFMRINKTRRG